MSFGCDFRGRLSGSSTKLNRRGHMAVGARDLLPVHIRRDPELTTATGTAKRQRDLAGRCRCRLRPKCINWNFDRLRARRTLDDLSSLSGSDLERLLATRASKNKRAQFTLSRRVKDSITGVSQSRHDKFLVIESLVNNARVDIDIGKLFPHFFDSLGGSDD